MGNINYDSLEEQIESEQKSVKYDIREFTVEYYADKYNKGVENDSNELFVPDYQREFIWTDPQQSRFIESLILGLPVPLIFVAEDKSGRFEIVDGSQRIRTLNAFVSGELTLCGLKKLTKLNGLKFSDFSNARQRKFKNISMRMIVLNEYTTPEIRNEMFDRINTSGVALLPMETRRGIYKGPFTDFIIRLAKNELFAKLCPESVYMKDRREEEEMILRFFAFSETYPNFKLKNGSNLKNSSVAEYLNQYLSIKNEEENTEDMSAKEKEFLMMIKFIDENFPNQGFAKAPKVVGVSKPYFEAISIGALLALRENPNLKPKSISWSRLNKSQTTPFFTMLSGRYRTHTPQKLLERIDYAKFNFLKS